MNDEYALAYAILQQLTRIADALEKMIEEQDDEEDSTDSDAELCGDRG